MPISKEKDPSKNIARLAGSHPEMPPAQRVAVGLAEARRAGTKVPPPPSHGRNDDPHAYHEATVKDLMDAVKGPVTKELAQREGRRLMSKKMERTEEVQPVRSSEDQPMSELFKGEDAMTNEDIEKAQR